jgi:hypothetical protein
MFWRSSSKASTTTSDRGSGGSSMTRFRPLVALAGSASLGTTCRKVSPHAHNRTLVIVLTTAARQVIADQAGGAKRVVLLRSDWGISPVTGEHLPSTCRALRPPLHNPGYRCCRRLNAAAAPGRTAPRRTRPLPAGGDADSAIALQDRRPQTPIGPRWPTTRMTRISPQ